MPASLRDWTPRKERVLFRRWSDGDVVAIFPDTWVYGHLKRSFTLEGRHRGVDLRKTLRETRPATPEEYAPVLEALREIGYNLVVGGEETV